MAFPKKAKYVIIGAGIHGLSTAWHFADSYGLRANRRMHDWFPRILAVRSGGAFRGSISSRRIGARLYDGGTGIF